MSEGSKRARRGGRSVRVALSAFAVCVTGYLSLGTSRLCLDSEDGAHLIQSVPFAAGQERATVIITAQGGSVFLALPANLFVADFLGSDGTAGAAAVQEGTPGGPFADQGLIGNGGTLGNGGTPASSSFFLPSCGPRVSEPPAPSNALPVAPCTVVLARRDATSARSEGFTVVVSRTACGRPEEGTWGVKVEVVPEPVAP